MKPDIHPPYFPKAKITCSCGAVIVTGSTIESYTTELCSKCHPFYTGKRKTVDTAGRIEMFTLRKKLADQKKGEVAKKEEKKRRTIEDKVNEALQRDREQEMVKEQELMARIRKNRPVKAKKEVATPTAPVAEKSKKKTTRTKASTKAKTIKKAA